MHAYLNWWLGGIALGGFTILFRILTGRTLGVSGSCDSGHVHIICNV